jgi:hypothetical protein
VKKAVMSEMYHCTSARYQQAPVPVTMFGFLVLLFPTLEQGKTLKSIRNDSSCFSPEVFDEEHHVATFSSL